MDGAAAGKCSHGAAAILSAEVLTGEAFQRLLCEGDAVLFADAIIAWGEFHIDLTLKNGRMVELTAVPEGEGDGCVVHGTIEDITHRRAEVAQFNARDELCRAVAENSPTMLWMGDQNGKCVFLNQAQRDFWGVDPEDLSTFSWSSTIHPDDLEKLGAPFGKAMAERTPFMVEARYRRADGCRRLFGQRLHAQLGGVRSYQCCRSRAEGFGHAVIVDMVAATLDADVEVRFDQSGFKWLVRARSDAGLQPRA